MSDRPVTTAQVRSPAAATPETAAARFAAAWQSGMPPPLSDFLPDDPSAHAAALAELIRIDLNHRWRPGNVPRRLSDYVAEFRVLEGSLPAELIYEEIRLRRDQGERVEAEDYFRQFPHQADELRRLLERVSTSTPTVVEPPSFLNRPDELAPGGRVDDFDLLTLLGEGAFAKVFLARQRSMQRLVALKVSTDEGREPQTLAQFDHDNIVRVFDQRTDDRRGLRLLYMEYCPGGTLSELVSEFRHAPPDERSGGLLVRVLNEALDRRGEARLEGDTAATLAAMNWPEAVCWIGARLAAALEYAHRRGVLHRDIKPANVLLSRLGVPKLADFNISFSAELEGSTPEEQFGGSLAYMSPEQLEAFHPGRARRADSLDGRSDQYSLGVLLWELLTGRRPFDDSQDTGSLPLRLDRMIARRQQPIPSASYERLPPDWPRGLIHVLQRCLAPGPDDRWPGGKELAHQLDLCRDRGFQALVNPPPESRRVRWRAYAVPLVVLAAAVPNILAGAFNLAYNHGEIVTHLSETQQQAFWRIQAVINSIAYPVGLGLIGVLSWSITRVIRARARGERVAAARFRAACRRCVALGHTSALIGVTLWAVAGVAYPVSIHLAAGALNAPAYAHFLASLVLCGLISAAYPFFGASVIALRLLYPQLLGDDVPPPGDIHLLERLDHRASYYLALAVSVPLVAMLVLAGMSFGSRWALIALSGGALVGFAMAYRWFRRLQADLAVLTHALSPERGR
ncbi:MAG TPA: serine/threonine-protein kinase [Planctomycetaceae bacterium]|nr:serine/threonine-protein kinase [Planctomycetaceae bacterium]